MQPIDRAVPGAVAQLLRGAALSPGKIEFAWTVSVGPALQRATAVRLEGSVLVVDTASVAWTRAIVRSTPIILKKLEALLGPAVVTSLAVRNPDDESHGPDSGMRRQHRTRQT